MTTETPTTATTPSTETTPPAAAPTGGRATGTTTFAPSTAAPAARGDAEVAATILAAVDGAWRDLREQIRADWDPADVLVEPGLSTADYRVRTTENLHTLAAGEYGRFGFPHAFGGTRDYGASCVSFEMLGYGDLSLQVKLGVQFGLFGGAVARLGTERHHERYLPGIMSAQILGSFAMTEIGHGSNVQALETTATYDPATREFVLDSPTESSVKTYIGNAAADARYAVVFAQLITGGDQPEQHGVHALLVEVRDAEGKPLPGVTIGDNGEKAGLPGVDNGTFSFAQVRVPKDALLNKYGDVDDDGTYVSEIGSTNARFFTMLGTLVRGRVCVGGGAGFAARKALTIAVRYGERRRQFDAPDQEQETVILDYLAHQKKLLPRLATTYAFAFAQNQLIERLEELHGAGATGPRDAAAQEAQRELETQVAGLKALQTWHALDTIQACREACGGAGFIAENEFGRMRADVDVFTTFEGDNTVLLQLVAKGLLTEYKEMWGDLDQAGMVGMVSRQVAAGLVERTTGRAGLQKLLDLAKGRSDDSALDDRGWQLSMFEQRADHALETVARRLQKAPKDEAFEAFNNAQDHVLFAARAHVDRLVMEAFAEAVDAMPEGEARVLLDQVCSLYALNSIDADRAWFLEHGRLDTSRSRAVTAQVNTLTRQLRPHARTLVDGLGVPEGFLRAPIAQD